MSTGVRVWVKSPGYGYGYGYGFVGVGEVTGPREPITSFQEQTPEGDRSAADALAGATYHRELVADSDRMEYFVSVRWLHSVSLDEAANEIGMFGNHNTVCKPTTPKLRTTVDRIKQRWRIGEAMA